MDLNELCGIAIARFGMTSNEFYQLTPIEFHYALKDCEATQKAYFEPVKLICEVLRMVAMTVYNSAYGRKRAQLIKDPAKLIQFSWEKTQVQTVDQMKAFIVGLAHIKGVKVTQQGKDLKS